ncbi:hypothetical protein [Pantoea agglomerans]|uniref:hypothetical protein n=1 Tax=Enterobacter agglomerans TaxID=549 RepID=UPI000DFDB156|nr:hypothetical protein [Pantoea agglomerans]SUC48980.1 Uncharacterised protein [Pantoea agglomerans]
MKNYEKENIKNYYADIMRNHTAVEALKYSEYSEVPRWLKITNTAFMIIKRTEEQFKAIEIEEEKESLAKALNISPFLFTQEIDQNLYRNNKIQELNLALTKKKSIKRI